MKSKVLYWYIDIVNILDLPKLSILSIGNEAFGNSTIFHLSNLNSIQSLNIGNNKFNQVSTFMIEGFQSLTTLSIGSNSFTQKKNDWGNDIDKSKSFHILNCTKLESIEIGEYSFSDYGGQFELNGLPELQSLIIGSNSTDSYNFYSSSSFEIESIILIYWNC